ncbi:MAG: translocation/assembly module TamB domain-containing protein, partial [Myxococcaceae bacterium]
SRDRRVSTEAGAGLAAEALFSAVGLDKQVQRFLPKNALLRDMSFHLSTTYNEASGVVEPTAQLESKFLTDRLKLGMSQPVSGRGTRAQAEYQFNDRLSARAQWDNENQDYSFGNPGLDLKLRWEWE